MNYFRVQGVGLLGLQGIPVEVECMQSRRLPYLQILGSTAGSAAEMRERVLAALESAGCRLPARRITVRFQPGIHGFPLENLDLAMALAILAASGKIPSNRLEEVLVSGSLGLNGHIQAVGSEFAAQKIFGSKKFRGAIVPFEESAWLSEPNLVHGGGFCTLAEVIAFLTGDKKGNCRIFPDQAGKKAPKFWRGTQSGARLLEIAAAGGHHTLLLAPDAAEVESLALALAQAQPPLGRAECLESEFFARLRGNMSNGEPAYIQIPFESKTESRNHAFHPLEELLFARNGVIYLDRLAERPAQSTAPVLSWMESGKVEWSRLGHRFTESLEATVIAGAATCECGGRNFGKCSCRPLDLQKYRRRLERAAGGPFDLRYCLAQAGEKQEVDLSALAERVAQARALMRRRKGILNGRLSAEDALCAKNWESKALLRLRSLSLGPAHRAPGQAALARVALTLSDLRGGSEVSEQDLLEARHYSWLE